MNNKYEIDADGNTVLILNHDGRMTTDINVENGSICLFNYIYAYDSSSFLSIEIEDWRQVKEFIDKQIARLGVPKALLWGDR